MKGKTRPGNAGAIQFRPVHPLPFVPPLSNNSFLISIAMSVIVAQALHIFGFQSRVANNICFFDEQIIVYPAGNSCVKYHIEQKWQKFIAGKLAFPPFSLI